MLDSLLTLTKGGAIWMVAFLVIFLLVDRVLTLLTGRQEILFGLLAACTALALVIAGVYTLGKLAIRRLHHQ